MDEPLMTLTEAADYLGIKPRQLDAMRLSAGGLLPYVHHLNIGSRDSEEVRFLQSDLDEWKRRLVKAVAKDWRLLNNAGRLGLLP